MAILTYLDASGDEHKPAISVAGFISRPGRWEAFEQEWAAVLGNADVPELHMQEFAHRVGPFEGWTEAGRIELISSLIDVIDRYAIKSTGTTLLMDHWRRFEERVYLREGLGNPYAFTALNAIVGCVTWRDENCEGEPIAFVLEHGDYGQGELIDVVNRLGFSESGVSVTVKAKKWTDSSGETHYCYPFQACDYLAYEHFKAMKKAIRLGVHEEPVSAVEFKPRKSLTASKLAPRGRDPLWRFLNLYTIAAFCRAFKVYRRPDDEDVGS